MSASRIAPEMKNTPPKSRARRRRIVRRGRRSRRLDRRPPAGSWYSSRTLTGASDPVAGLGDGVDDRGIAELCAQPADGDLDRVRERVRGLVPDPREELLGGDAASLRGK